ncbi:MAG: hypothetical protein ACYS21_13525, partial [Planctomycetota bacterium]
RFSVNMLITANLPKNAYQIPPILYLFVEAATEMDAGAKPLSFATAPPIPGNDHSSIRTNP